MNKTRFLKKYDKKISLILCLIIVLFLIMFFMNEDFFNWAFKRHQNILSWYIRPLFLIPFCYFSYKRSFSGIAITVLGVLTSMFWFSEPVTVDAQVSNFLSMEKKYLMTDWTVSKILITSAVPLSLIILSIAFWKRNILLGIINLVIIAVGKIIWSIGFGGDEGKKIILPEFTGLVLCIILIYAGIKAKGRNDL